MFDLIGDVHGHAEELAALLGTLGYQRQRNVFRHPERRAVFVGDLIDRGPAIREAVRLARDMVEAVAALAALGNHEINALALNTPDPDAPGEHLRRRTLVCFGHYWLADPTPVPLAANVACLDYSVARGGFLCAYRFDGEAALSRERFARTPTPSTGSAP